MTPELWQRIESILQQALELSPHESEAFLDEACGSNVALRREVESLIEADKRAGKLLARPILAVGREIQHTTIKEPLGMPVASGDSDDRQGGPVIDAFDEGKYLPGAILTGRYRIVSFLGRGGMGEVYRADDLELDQAVALKFLPEPMEGDPVSLSQLQAEVRIARQISHPSVCRVHDIGEAGGRHFLSMEYIEGEDMASLLRRIGRLPKDKALEIAQQLCHGLAAAHEQGVLHRDLKPSNLMIDGRGRARITDFGISAPVGRPTGAETRCGTPAYMAPEQLVGQAASIQSDLYALGLVLYELFTGQRALQSGSIATLARRQQEASIELPSRLVPGLDLAIEEAILSCVERDARDRPESAQAVAAALAAYTAGHEWLPTPGQAIPHRSSWVLEKKLGAGGFGEVWLVRHRKTLDRRVFKLGHGVAGRRALQREIAVFRLLKDGLGDRDDIARILDWSIDEPPYFIESEYTEGGNLFEWAEEKGGIEAVPLVLRLEIVAQVATALAAAHSVGVLHKDVKPANVLITHDREPKPSAGRLRAQLIDFGLGAVTERRRLIDAGITLPRSALIGSSDDLGGGTQLYMAPELLEGKAATLQSDVYALGIMLYQMVVGDFSRVLAPGWRRDVGDGHLCEDIAEAVDGSPERRLADARELARRLRSLDQRRTEFASRQRAREAASRTREALELSHRRRKLAAAATVALAVVAVALGLLASLIAREKQRAEQETARAKNFARVAVAGEWLHKDPTKASLVLIEVENPEGTAYAISQMRQVLSQRLATVELRGHEGPIQSVSWSPLGDRIVTTAPGLNARIWNVVSGESIVLEHEEQVLTAWFDPRGQQIVTLSVKGTARVWQFDGTGGAMIFEGPDSSLQAAAMGPLGDRIATGSWAGAVRLWDIAADRDPLQLGSHDGPVTAVSFSPRGDRIVTASQDGTARIWRLDGTGNAIDLAHGRAVVAVSFGPRGDRVLTICMDGTVRVWNGFDDAIVFEIDVRGEPLVDAAWSPDGERIIIGSRGIAWVWNADGSGEPIVFEDHKDAVAVAFSPTGDKVLIASRFGTASVWNADGSGEPITLKGNHGIALASFDPSGKNILIGSRQGTARVWDIGRPTEPVLLEHQEAVRHASWSPTGDRIVTVPWDGAVRIWDGAGTAQPTLLEGHSDAVLAASWSPRGERIVTASSDGTARVWRADSSGESFALEGHTDKVLTASWSPRGERIVTGSGDGTARVWKADGSGDSVVLGPHKSPVTAARWSPRGDRIVTATVSGTTAQLWHPDGTAPPIVLEGHDAPVEVVAFDSRGGRVLTASGDGTARVWSVGGSDEPTVLGGHDDFIFAAVFAPGDERVVTATATGIVRLWNLDDPGEPVVLVGHRSAVNAVSWSPRGDRFVTVSEDGTANVWSSEGKSEYMALDGHTGPVVAASWNSLGDRIVTASRDGTARVWRANSLDLIAAIRAATRVCLAPEFREKHLGEPLEEARRRSLECASTLLE